MITLYNRLMYMLTPVNLESSSPAPAGPDSIVALDPPQGTSHKRTNQTLSHTSPMAGSTYYIPNADSEIGRLFT